MRLVDVDVLVCGHRLDAPHHQADAAWFGDLLAGQEPYGIADLVLGGFLRIVTNPKVFSQPTPVETALDFAGLVRSQPTCVPVEPGQRHWGIFTGLGRSAASRGTGCPTPTWPRWRSSRAASGSPPTTTSAGSPGCGGVIRSRNSRPDAWHHHRVPAGAPCRGHRRYCPLGTSTSAHPNGANR
jgi:uncharacterized protein